MLPHISGRPLSLVRCPEGSAKPCFFQKHVNATLPRGIGTVEVPDKKTGKIEPYITLDSAEILASLAQLGVLEVHPWGSRNEDLEHPDRLIFDLDPDESLAWPAVTAAAAAVRSRLKKLGLTSFLKTTGGKGLHVVIPIEPTLDWPAAKDFAHRFVLAMEKANPRLYLTKMTKSARAGKIYLDYLRNERGATAVAAYSTRVPAPEPASPCCLLAWTETAANLPPPSARIFRVADFASWRRSPRRKISRGRASPPSTSRSRSQPTSRPHGFIQYQFNYSRRKASQARSQGFGRFQKQKRSRFSPPPEAKNARPGHGRYARSRKQIASFLRRGRWDSAGIGQDVIGASRNGRRKPVAQCRTQLVTLLLMLCGEALVVPGREADQAGSLAYCNGPGAQMPNQIVEVAIAGIHSRLAAR